MSGIAELAKHAKAEVGPETHIFAYPNVERVVSSIRCGVTKTFMQQMEAQLKAMEQGEFPDPKMPLVEEDVVRKSDEVVQRPDIVTFATAAMLGEYRHSAQDRLPPPRLPLVQLISTDIIRPKPN